MFNYQVMTEADAMAARFQLLKNGEYDAVINRVDHKISHNSGNDMLDMTLSVYDENGVEYIVRDFLVFTKTMMWKVIHCARSAGLEKEYLENKLTPELLKGSSVRVQVKIEKGSIIPSDKLQGKPEGSTYPDKNKIEDYVEKSTIAATAKSVATQQSTNANQAPAFDDDIPF